ncbi:hypothetical protein CSUB01_04475 [Colletotrichum sublineola]|uniref:Uncharacterized protein n=1 Tax=Colletotrichum sublineola TaxID=1173701 RepID=A0A066XSC9_COLSU|nr:hypothetical protein CSUB01_04475 [Colletotrichum sublineola]
MTLLCRPLEQRPAVASRGTDRRPAVNERLDDGLVALVSRPPQRRVSVSVGRVRVRPGAQERLHGPELSVPCSPPQTGVSFSVLELEIKAAGSQDRVHQRPVVAAHDGLVQGRPPFGVGDVELGAFADEEFGKGPAPVGHRPVQRRLASTRLRVKVNDDPAIRDGLPDQLLEAEEGRDMHPGRVGLVRHPRVRHGTHRGVKPGPVRDEAPRQFVQLALSARLLVQVDAPEIGGVAEEGVLPADIVRTRLGRPFGADRQPCETVQAGLRQQRRRHCVFVGEYERLVLFDVYTGGPVGQTDDAPVVGVGKDDHDADAR